MASSKIKGINIKIGADTTGLATALKKVEDSGKSTEKELGEIKRAIKQNADSVVLWQQKQEVLTKAIENSKDKTKLLLQAQKGIEQAFRDGDIDRQAYDKFHEKIRKATDKLNDLKNLQEDFKNKLDSGEIGEETYKDFIKKVEKAEREVQALENSQRSMEENVRLGTVSAEQYRAFQREIEDAERSTRNFENQLNEANQEVQRLGDEVQESGEQAGNSANGGYTVLGNVFANVITEGIKLAGTALKEFTQDVVVTGAEYESAISNVVAISGAMSEEVEMLQAKAEEMGATTKFTAVESAEAMGYMAMAGWKVNDMVSGLDGIMDLSAASGEDLASVSDIVTDALTAFGLAASDSAHFADVLAAASSNANTNVAMMGETFQYSAPLAGTMGYSIEDMALATGLMANSGIKASQAGTSLNTALARLAKPTKEMKKYMQELGLVTMQTFDQSADPKAIEKAMSVVENKALSAENAQIKLNQAIERYGEKSAQALTATNNLTKAQNSLEEAQEALTDLQNGEKVSIIDKNLLLTDEEGNLKSLRETIDTLRESFSGLSEAEQAETASAIFGKNSMSGMLAIVNAKQADYDKLVEAVDNANGTAKEMANTMLDNLQGDKTLLDSALDGMKIAISKEINPALRELVQYATTQIPKIQAVAEPLFKGAVNGVKTLISGFEKIKPVLSAVKPLILTIFANKAISLFATSLLPKTLELLKKIPSPLSLITKPIEIVAKAPQTLTVLLNKIKTVPTLLGKVGSAFKGLWTVISAHPIAAFATVAITAGLALKSYIDNLEVEKTEVELLIEKHNEELQLLADKRQAIEDLNDAFYENVDGIQNQTDRTKDLWTELDKLADQYGNVQEKDKARAEYILNELNNALGTEYTMTGNQIENYKNLSAEIDNVIAKKQAEMMLDSYLANSTEMTKQRTEARTDYENADKDYQEKQKIAEEAEQDYKELTGRDPSEIPLYSDRIDEKLKSISESQEEYDAGMAVYTARIEAMSAEDAKTQAKLNYEATSEYFTNLDQLQEAYSLGQYDRMADIIYAEQDLTSTTLDESATDAEQRLAIYSDNLQKVLSDFELAVGDMKQSSVDELEKEFTNLMQSGAVADIDALETWEQFKPQVLDFQKNGLDISPIISGLADSGITPAGAFGNDWKTVFKTQLANGGDMESMLKWLDNSEYHNSIPLVFGNNENFIKHINEQSAKGLDVSPMLEFGINSGLAESEDFVKIFKSNFSKSLEEGGYVGNLLELSSKAGIDLGEEMGASFGEQMEVLNTNGIDLITFIKWAETNGKSVAEVFGENFYTELSEYMKLDFQNNFKNFAENNTFFDFFYGKKTLSERLTKTFADGKSLSTLSKQARRNGLKIGDVFGSDFMNVIQEQINDGYDIQELVQWAIESGEEVSKEYSDVYTEIIQQQIDNGYNITELLAWGEKSGFETGNMLGKNYTNEVQKFVDSDFSIVSLLEWAESAGYKVGDVFGKKFQEIANIYMQVAEVQQVAENTGNIIDGILGKLPFMADGGFLSHGQAVVAEAGPELLEVMNGGVRVTPLTRNSRNTPVSDNGGQKIFYSNYTINATISNGYDVARLAEDLETERRRIERGLGK